MCFFDSTPDLTDWHGSHVSELWNVQDTYPIPAIIVAFSPLASKEIYYSPRLLASQGGQRASN